MKLSDYVIDCLDRAGVKHVFMLPGGGAMHLNDSLGKHPRVKFICNLHEQASSIAAEAYGQYAGLGVAMVTTGPGGTNAVTGVAGAWLESTPLLVISGQVKRADLVGSRRVRQIGFQEIDIVNIVKPITKYAVTVVDPQSIRACLEEGIWQALHGRKGPVWIDIPLDVQASDIDPKKLRSYTPPVVSDARAAIRESARRTVELLSKSRCPVLLLGNGVRHADAIGLVAQWATQVQIPILTTWKALDFFPEDHPLFIGRPGAVGQRAANFAQQTSDVFISIGARLDFGQTAYNHSNFAPRAQRIFVDIDPHELAKMEMESAISLTADAGDFLRALLELLPDSHFPDWSPWRARCAEWKKRYPLVLPSYRDVSSGVNNYVFVEALGRQLKYGDLLVPGSSGACSEVTCQALPAVPGLRFINTQGLGAMGFGVPAALGACMAANQKRTVCIDGDGGFIMNAQELSIIAKLKLPIKFFVLNNAGYCSIRTTQINYFQERFVACGEDSGLYLPDIEKVAHCYNLPFRKISSQADIDVEISEALAADGPVVCEVVMSPNQFTQPKVSSKQQEDGRMVTMPMEDLWPFLDRAEFEGAIGHKELH